MTVFRGRRLAALLAVLLPLLGGVRVIPHAPTAGTLRAPLKGPRKCVAERAEGASAQRGPRARLGPSPLAGGAAEILQSFVSRPVSADPLRTSDWDRLPRALKLCLARDSHPTLAPPAL